MNEATQPLTLVCRHIATECGNTEIAKLGKEKARAHQKTFRPRQDNAKLRNELYSCRRALGRTRQCIDALKAQYTECKKLLQDLITKLEARR